jgi:Cu-Zn family superoxide dismutase
MYKNRGTTDGIINYLVKRNPDAIARIHGSKDYPEINGIVSFFQTRTGVFVICSVKGLPADDKTCDGSIFGIHIHEGGSCSGNSIDPFSETGGHYNPDNCPHPFHAGDLPPLFADKGYAWYAFLTQRFDVIEIIGKTVVIHSQPDDFTSQPSGNSGDKLACGKIAPVS